MHIIGGPGSGESTCARQIGLRLGAHAIELDRIAYGPGGVKRTLAERSASVHDILGCHQFVTEGIYLWWIDDLLECADVIVWLDVPFRVAAWRTVSRHVRASLAGANQLPGIGRLLAFLRSSRRYYMEPLSGLPAGADDDGSVTRAQTARELARYTAKVVRDRSSASAQRIGYEWRGQEGRTRSP